MTRPGVKRATPILDVVAKMARGIFDDDGFVGDCTRIIGNYKEWAEFDSKRPKMSEIRDALKEFQTRAAALADWLERSSLVGAAERPEQWARMKLNGAFDGGREREMKETQTSLSALSVEVPRILERRWNRNLRMAPRVAAAILHNAFVTRSLQAPTGQAAVKLLQAIVVEAGGRQLTPNAAKQYLRRERLGTLWGKNSPP